jgi:hypothetical protein
VKACTCESCGLPSWAVADEGVRIKLRQKAENSFRRDRVRTVWCCSRPCADQAFALSVMGPASHRWPVTLAEFTAGHHDEIDQAIQGQSDRPETYAGPRIISGVAEPNLEVMGLPHMGVVSGRREGSYARSGGRPRKWKSEAERKRAERHRQRATRVQ